MDNKVNAVLPSLYKSQMYKSNEGGKDAQQEISVLQNADTQKNEESKSYELTLSESAIKNSEQKILEEKLREMEEQKLKQMFNLPEDSNLEELKEMLIKMKKQRFESLIQSARMRFPHQYTKESWKNFARLMTEAMSMSARQSVNWEKAILTLQRGLNGLRFSGVKKEYKNFYKNLPADPYKDPRASAQEAFLKNHNKNNEQSSPVPQPREERTTKTNFYDSNAGMTTDITISTTSTVEVIV